jgi:uncharacterized protein (DUF169 family)
MPPPLYRGFFDLVSSRTMRSDWTSLDRTLRDGLKLGHAPVAVIFGAAPPAGVRKFMGSAPSTCSYWRIAQTAPAGKSAFYTVPSDHLNCPIGAYTHRVDVPPDRADELTDVLGLMAKIGYVKMEEVPAIPRWATAPGAVTYAQLGETPAPPDVVVLSVSARAAMLLGEAARAAGVQAPIEPLARPTCMALPAAAAQGTTTSLGCVGNRVYTDLSDGDLYVVLRGGDVPAIVQALDGILQANAQLAAYHADRRDRLTS